MDPEWIRIWNAEPLATLESTKSADEIFGSLAHLFNEFSGTAD